MFGHNVCFCWRPLTSRIDTATTRRRLHSAWMDRVFETPQTGVHSADLLLIPPDIPHAHPAFGATAMLFLEPESVDWAHFSDHGSGGLVPLSFDHALRSWPAAPLPAMLRGAGVGGPSDWAKP